MDTEDTKTRNTEIAADTAAERGQVVGSAAEVYEQFFVPALFGQFAPIAVDRAGIGRGDHVLDVGCGTGAVARTARPVVGADGRVVGVDINEAMLTVARSLDDTIDWVEAPAESLPTAIGSFDAVVCQFGLMFVVDRQAALAETARVLRPGGTVVVSTWADVSTSPGYEALIELLDEEIGATAADALRAPFTIGSEAELAEIVATTFATVDVSTEAGTARFPSLESWLHCDVRGWTLADMIDDEAFDVLLAAARSRLSRFVDSAGAVSFDAPAIIAVASASD